MVIVPRFVVTVIFSPADTALPHASFICTLVIWNELEPSAGSWLLSELNCICPEGTSGIKETDVVADNPPICAVASATPTDFTDLTSNEIRPSGPVTTWTPLAELPSASRATSLPNVAETVTRSPFRILPNSSVTGELNIDDILSPLAIICDGVAVRLMLAAGPAYSETWVFVETTGVASGGLVPSSIHKSAVPAKVSR